MEELSLPLKGCREKVQRAGPVPHLDSTALEVWVLSEVTLGCEHERASPTCCLLCSGVSKGERPSPPSSLTIYARQMKELALES